MSLKTPLNDRPETEHQPTGRSLKRRSRSDLRRVCNLTILPMCRAAAVLACLVLLNSMALCTRAGDWPQWAGSDSKNMVSPEKGLPTSFEPGAKKPDGTIDLSTPCVPVGRSAGCWAHAVPNSSSVCSPGTIPEAPFHPCLRPTTCPISTTMRSEWKTGPAFYGAQPPPSLAARFTASLWATLPLMMLE